MPCPDRLSQWSQEVSTALAHLRSRKSGAWSSGVLECGDRAVRNCRDCPNQCSTRAGVGTRCGTEQALLWTCLIMVIFALIAVARFQRN